MRQVDNHRKNIKQTDLQEAANEALENTKAALESGLASDLEEVSTRPTEVSTAEKLTPISIPSQVESREINVAYQGGVWLIYIELSCDPAHTDWLEVSNAIIPEEKAKTNKRAVGIRLSMNHPFSKQFVSAHSAPQLELMLRLAAALGLAEVTAENGNVKYAAVVRAFFNELLSGALSKPAVTKG